jgi:hypothetical protein
MYVLARSVKKTINFATPSRLLKQELRDIPVIRLENGLVSMEVTPQPLVKMYVVSEPAQK